MKSIPETEEEYFALLERIVKGAEYLENPLIKPEDYQKGMRLYDQLCEQVYAYHKAHRNNVGERNRSTAA